MKIKISAVTSGRNTAEYSRSTKMETLKQMLNVECPGLKRKHFSEETRKRATAIVHTQKKRQKPGYTGKHWSESSTAWPQTLTQNRSQVSSGQCTAVHLRGFCQPAPPDQHPLACITKVSGHISRKGTTTAGDWWNGERALQSLLRSLYVMTLGKGSCSSSYRKK